MAINPDTGEVLLACANRQRPHTVIFDLKDKKIASVIGESGAGDGAVYDPVAGRFFFAASGWHDAPARVGVTRIGKGRFYGLQGEEEVGPAQTERDEDRHERDCPEAAQ